MWRGRRSEAAPRECKAQQEGEHGEHNIDAVQAARRDDLANGSRPILLAIVFSCDRTHTCSSAAMFEAEASGDDEAMTAVPWPAKDAAVGTKSKERSESSAPIEGSKEGVASVSGQIV